MKKFRTILINIYLLAIVNISAYAKSYTSNPVNNSPVLAAETTLSNETTVHTVVLSWTAKNESRKNNFIIERSFYSNNFSTIASFQVPFTNAGSLNNFRINDDVSALTDRAIAYYRIKQIAADGHINYSNVIVVNLKDTKIIKTEQTGTIKNNTTILFSAFQNGNAIIRVKNITGQTVAARNEIISKGNNTVELKNLDMLSKGIYMTEVTANGVLIDSQKIIIE
jgi:hypothetical protein